MRLPVWLFALWTLLGTFATSGSAQTLHVVIAGDLSPSAGWGKYTSAVAMDLAMVSATISNNMPESKTDMVRLQIEEDEFSTPKFLLEAVARLEAQPNDSILFYFSGHGAADDQGHYIALAQGKLYREQLLSALESKKTRFVALITDCCNTRSDGYLYSAPYIHIKSPKQPSPLFRRLFLETTGIVDITSSSPGESAFFAPARDESGSPGSIFTLEWLEWLDQESHHPRSWDQMIRAVSLKVHNAFHDYYPKGASIAKGMPIQTQQNVFPLRYPGMPLSEGPRTGFIIRDFPGRGSVITEVVPDSPASSVFWIQKDQFVSLKPQQVIVSVNGKPTPNTEAVVQTVKSSPQIMRMTVRDANSGSMEVLMRMRY